MKSFHHFIISSFLAAVTLTMTGCWTSIWTVAPTTERELPPTTVYTTQVTTPSPKVTTTQTVVVTNYNNDWSFYLDLQAVAAAFAEANTVQEFERLLNSSRYMINNLDLNRDGWIDYLRVIETRQGYHHVFLIQACLAPSVFQDVATLIAEWRSDLLYVEVIGDRYLYGYNYVVRPVFVKRPPMWDVFGRPTYNPWSSPYYYGYYPSYYQQPKPVYLSHYQAYVNTYMHNHHYCHHCDYPQQPYWNGYSSMTQSHTRNDYAVAHPDNSFERRVTTTRSSSEPAIRNAGQLRQEVNRESQTTTSQRESQTVRPTTSTTRSSETTSTSTTRQSQTMTTTTRQTQTTQTKTTSTTSGRTAQTSQPVQQRQPSTSVNTRVNKSGESRTTIKTTDNTGRTQTVKRTSEPQRTTSTSTQRSSGTTQRSSGGTTRR